MNQPSVSLVVCTRNRASFLAPFFEAIRRIQTDLCWELIFVDSASTDDTPALLQSFASSFHQSVTIVRQNMPGLGRARNAGWPNARATIIAFTDDDCYPSPDFIDSVHAAFQRGDLGYLGGRVELFDKSDLPITIKTDLEPLQIAPCAFVGPGFIHGANLVFKKDALRAINGFDDLMGSGTPFPAEDCDAAFRASLAGFSGQYQPSVLVYHHHRRRTPEDRLKIEDSYTAGRGAFYMKSLAYSPKKLRTFFEWIKSANHFGWRLLPTEISVGRAYLRAHRGII